MNKDNSCYYKMEDKLFAIYKNEWYFSRYYIDAGVDDVMVFANLKKKYEVDDFSFLLMLLRYAEKLNQYHLVRKIVNKKKFFEIIQSKEHDYWIYFYSHQFKVVFCYYNYLLEAGVVKTKRDMFNKIITQKIKSRSIYDFHLSVQQMINVLTWDDINSLVDYFICADYHMYVYGHPFLLFRFCRETNFSSNTIIQFYLKLIEYYACFAHVDDLAFEVFTCLIKTDPDFDPNVVRQMIFSSAKINHNFVDKISGFK